MSVWASGVWASGVWADNVWEGLGAGEAQAEVTQTGGGTSRKNRKRFIHYSDFASREELEKTLRVQIRETVSVREAPARISLMEHMTASLLEVDRQIETSHKVLDDIQKMKDDEDKMLQVLLSL